MLEVGVVEFADERAGLAGGFLSPFHAFRAIGHRELILRASDADIKQSAFLVFGAFGDAA